MTKPLIQIDDEIREMNDAEFSEHKKMLDEKANALILENQKLEAKAVLLQKLGITAEEAVLLLA